VWAVLLLNCYLEQIEYNRSHFSRLECLKLTWVASLFGQEQTRA
jgi:hypothetical protein